eukprot:1143062-Pelagomonas_calceolata.AAC.1
MPFNSRDNDVSAFILGGARLACEGILLQRNPQATAEHTCTPFLAGRRWIRQFTSEHHLMDRPHTMLWLTKTYVRFGALFMGELAEMDCPLQTMHLCLLKHILG